ncbi:hypothetical protein MJM99_31895, partial [Salmonella enterica subsp. enterica serovar Kentucky]|nr:hypothetical protein [Salmonella enterica subsp. enterica serovar Kentucky]
MYRVGSGKLMSRGGGITTENDFASFPPSSSNPFPLRYPYKIRAGGQDDLSQQNPFAEGYGVLLILLMVIQAIANDKFIEVQKNA